MELCGKRSTENSSKLSPWRKSLMHLTTLQMHKEHSEKYKAVFLLLYSTKFLTKVFYPFNILSPFLGDVSLRTERSWQHSQTNEHNESGEQQRFIFSIWFHGNGFACCHTCWYFRRNSQEIRCVSDTKSYKVHALWWFNPQGSQAFEYSTQQRVSSENSWFRFGTFCCLKRRWLPLGVNWIRSYTMVSSSWDFTWQYEIH